MPTLRLCWRGKGPTALRGGLDPFDGHKDAQAAGIPQRIMTLEFDFCTAPQGVFHGESFHSEDENMYHENPKANT
jgi:hypothetical protein